jgi:hypothetical protein
MEMTSLTLIFVFGTKRIRGTMTQCAVMVDTSIRDFHRNISHHAVQLSYYAVLVNTLYVPDFTYDCFFRVAVCQCCWDDDQFARVCLANLLYMTSSTR